jgi:hypothetical protein
MAPRPSDDPPFVDSTAALASLYQAPLAEFIARRSTLTSQLKRSGHKDVAARIATATKPSRAAYLVNQVYWRAQSIYDAVLDAGTAARAAQQARLLGDTATDVGETLRIRDDAVSRAVEQAERVAADEGQGGSEAILAQVRATFEALAAHGREARLSHGHLTADVELPGLAAFAGLVLPSSPAAPPVRRFEVVARRPDAAREPEPAAVPDPRVVEAAARLEAIEQRHAAAVERAEELRRTTAAAEEAATIAERAAEEATRTATDARKVADRAAASRVAAEQDLARLGNERAAAEVHLRDLQGETPPTPPAPPAKARRARAPTKRRARTTPDQ